MLRARAEVLRDRGEPELSRAIDELLGHFGLLPPLGILPPLDPATDAVAVGLGRALGATTGNARANVDLLGTYRFLGGKFTPAVDWVVELPNDPPPADRLARWRWFCTHVSDAAARIDGIWRDLVDPPM
jgi:hypothetical protein